MLRRKLRLKLNMLKYSISKPNNINNLCNRA